MPAGIKINKICRICMENEDDLKDIFEKLEGETTTADILKECTNYPVSRFDKLPQSICKKCRVEALVAFKFKQKCEGSHCKLVSLLRLSNECIFHLETLIEKETDPLQIEDQLKTGNHLFTCNICEHQFSSLEILEHHVSLIHKTEENTSNEESKSQDELKGDMESPVEVSSKLGCNKDDEKSLAEIQRTNGDNELNKNGDPLFPCEICNKVFKKASNLDKHITARHNSSEETQLENIENSHKCTICDRSFSTNVYLKRHVGSHKKRKRGSHCRECSKCFPTKDELIAHVKAEGHDKPLLCPECGFRCRTSHILMVHMRRHSGEKPFKCKFCSKGFPRFTDLRTHEKYHTGEKSHFCDICGKGFQRKYNLTIHLRVHTREKPYKCQHCPQAFAQANDLKAHVRRHTGERFLCDLCGATFLQSYQTRQHKWCEHGIREEPPTQRVAKFTSSELKEILTKQNLQHELKLSMDSTTLNESIINVELDSLAMDFNELGTSASDVLQSLDASDFTNIQF